MYQIPPIQSGSRYLPSLLSYHMKKVPQHVINPMISILLASSHSNPVLGFLSPSVIMVKLQLDHSRTFSNYFPGIQSNSRQVEPECSVHLSRQVWAYPL